MDRDPLADAAREPGRAPESARGLAPRAMAALVMAAVLALGIAAGIALDRGPLHGGRPRREDRVFVPGAPLREPPGPPRADRRHPASFDKFVRDLGLTPAQSAAVDSVMTQDFAAVRALRATLQPSVDSIVSRTRQRIDSILTPTQREKYRAMVADQQQRAAAARR
jgi:hypothetical protein